MANDYLSRINNYLNGGFFDGRGPKAALKRVSFRAVEPDALRLGQIRNRAIDYDDVHSSPQDKVFGIDARNRHKKGT